MFYCECENQVRKKDVSGTLYFINCEYDIMKFKKGDLVQSYSDKTTRGIIKYYDKEEGAWLVKLTTGTLNLVFFREDEPTLYVGIGIKL